MEEYYRTDEYFALLKYIQMAESLGFEIREEDEEGFNSFLTEKQIKIRFINAYFWIEKNIVKFPRIYSLIFKESLDIKKLRILLNQQKFKKEKIEDLVLAIKQLKMKIKGI